MGGVKTNETIGFMSSSDMLNPRCLVMRELYLNRLYFDWGAYFLDYGILHVFRSMTIFNVIYVRLIVESMYVLLKVGMLVGSIIE